MAKAKHYVNNEKFFEAMSEYRKEYLEAKDNEEEPPPLPEYVGECILLMAERLSHRPNFMNYTFREEMIGDGIENCIMYASNFDPEKSKNPFAYFTQILYYAFLRRIEKEKTQLYFKFKKMNDTDGIEEFVNNESSGDVVFQGSPMTADKKASIYEFIDNFEQKKEKKRKKRAESSSNTVIKMNPLLALYEEAL